MTDLINTLPNEILLDIFNTFSYKGQYKLGVVCYKWYRCIHMFDVDHSARRIMFGSSIDNMLNDCKHLDGILLTCMIINILCELMQPIAKYRFMTDVGLCRAIEHLCVSNYGRDRAINKMIHNFYRIFDGRRAPYDDIFNCCCIL